MTSHETLKSALAAFTASGTIAVAVAPAPAMEADSQGLDGAAEFSELAGAMLSLADAVAAAENQSGGKAVEVALDNVSANAAFQVQIVTANGSHRLAVDAATCVVTEVADGSEGEKGGGNEDSK